MASCKRILIIGRPNSGKLAFLKSLTGSLPEGISTDSHGGLTHQLSLKTKYYEALVDIWMDEYEEPRTFGDMYLSAEAAEVLASLGAIVLCLANHVDAIEEIKHIRRVTEACSSGLLSLVVLRKSPQSSDEQQLLEDQCLDHGAELVCMDATGKTDFGERQGIERARECIETADWSDLLDEVDEDEIETLLKEDRQLNERLLINDLASSDLSIDDASVEDLEGLMQRILQAREHSSDMSVEDKKKMAAKLIADVMRT